MLRAFFRWLWPQEAVQTRPGPPPEYVTRQEIEQMLTKFEQRTEFELGEWFDKFSSLHARTEKRVNRDRQNKGKDPVAPELPQALPSVLAYRKPWSV